MADGTVDTPVVDTPKEPTTEQQIAQLMQAQGITSNNPAATPPPNQDAPPDTQADTPPPTTDVSDGNVPRETFDFTPFKEKYGYNTAEDALAEIERLRGASNTPQRPKFENEISEKLYDALTKGEIKAVKEYLNQQDELDRFTTQEVNDETAGDIIKAAMKVQYPNLTSQEIDYKYNKQYSIPKEPIQKDDELDEDFTLRHAEWKERVSDVKMGKTIDAKLALPHLEGAKSKLVFPTFESAPDEGYAAYQQMMADAEKFDAQTKESYKNVSPTDFVTKLKYVDAKKGIDHDFSYTPSKETLDKVIEIVSDNQKFFSTFLNSDGSPNRNLWVDAVMYALDKNNILMNAMQEGSNALLRAQLPDNSVGSFNRNPPQEFEGNELDAAMAASGIRKGAAA